MSIPTDTDDLDALLADGNNSPKERAGLDALLRATLAALAEQQAHEKWPGIRLDASRRHQASVWYG